MSDAKRIDVLEDRLRTMPDLRIVDAVTAATAGNTFTVAHGMEGTPSDVFGFSQVPVTVWATTEDRRMWTSRFVTVRADVASAKVTLLIAIRGE